MLLYIGPPSQSPFLQVSSNVETEKVQSLIWFFSTRSCITILFIHSHCHWDPYLLPLLSITMPGCSTDPMLFTDLKAFSLPSTIFYLKIFL